MVLRTVSIALSLASFCVTLWINNQIAHRYLHADGKTQAMFGIIELVEFNYRYLILIPAIVSIYLVVRIIRSKEFKLWDIVTILVATLAIIGAVTSSWKLFVY